MGATGRLRGGLVILIGVSVATALGVAYLHLSGRERVKPEARTARQSAPSERTRVYVGAARRALGAVQDVQSLVHQGITLPEYQRRIADARISVDRFLRAHAVDLAPASREDMESALRLYETAARAWEGEIRAEAYGQNKLASRLKGHMQDCWKWADRAGDGLALWRGSSDVYGGGVPSVVLTLRRSHAIMCTSGTHGRWRRW
jgi:hypothetical protein